MVGHKFVGLQGSGRGGIPVAMGLGRYSGRAAVNLLNPYSMNHTRHFWNLASGTVVLSLLILVFQPSSRSLGDSLSSALGNIVSDSEPVVEEAVSKNRFVSQIAFPAPSDEVKNIVVGQVLSERQLKQLEPVPALISRQYHSPENKCSFRFHEGRVVIIHNRTNRVLDIEKSRVLIEL